ncbi:hypothetical protein GW17_00060857, partial [Ensete ventricosum]
SATEITAEKVPTAAGTPPKSWQRKLQRELGAPLFAVGALCKMSPGTQTSLLDTYRGCVGWLDKQSPSSVLYVSTGSLASVDEKQLVDNYFYGAGREGFIVNLGNKNKILIIFVYK